MKKIFYILALFSCILLGCEKEANIDLPETEPLLVIGSFLSPQEENISVAVSQTKPFYYSKSFQYSPDVIRNAKVILSDGSSEIEIPFNNDFGVYLISAKEFPLQSGKTYYLRVTTPDGRRAEAQCKIPDKTNTTITATKDSMDFESWIGGPLERHQVLNMLWTDLPGGGDYYKLYAHESFYLTKQDGSKDTVIFKINYQDYDSQPIFTDEKKDGADFFLKTGRLSNYVCTSCSSTDRNATIYLYTVNKDYHKYYQSLSKNQDGDNPFIEPSFVYTNVKGGIGIFAAYNLHIVEIDLNQ